MSQARGGKDYSLAYSVFSGLLAETEVLPLASRLERATIHKNTQQ